MAYSKSSTHLNPFSYDSTNWTFFCTTQRIEPFSARLKELNPFLKRLNELNIFSDPKNWTFFVECDPKNWTFFVECDPKNWIIVGKHEELILFTNMTENWTLFEPFHMTRRNEHFLKWLKELNLFECDSKNWNFPIWRTELNISFLEYDAQNWTSLFSNMTHRIEHLFSRIWRTELNISFLEYDAQNWTSLFSNMTHRIEHLISSRIWLTEFF